MKLPPPTNQTMDSLLLNTHQKALTLSAISHMHQNAFSIKEVVASLLVSTGFQSLKNYLLITGYLLKSILQKQ